MRAIEFEGIEKLPAGEYRGGKSSLYHPKHIKAEPTQPLPGGSGFVYTIGPGQYGTEIKIWDPNGQDYINSTIKPVRKPKEQDWEFNGRLQYWEWDLIRARNTPGQLIGKLLIAPTGWFPLPGAVQVDVITVDEDYRGQGIAKALYGIVLTIMKLPLVAGETQTVGGRRNWVSLAGIPGVDMKGWIGLEDYELTPRAAPKDTDAVDIDPNKEARAADKNIDTIMGKLGGDYIGQTPTGRRVFAFDVTPNATGKELEAYVKTKMTKIYGDTDYNSGLYAIWSGT